MPDNNDFTEIEIEFSEEEAEAIRKASSLKGVTFEKYVEDALASFITRWKENANGQPDSETEG
jgi:predicted DNA binding CopG/RHH family protein